MIEYLLLLSVLVVIGNAIMRSPTFIKFFGENGIMGSIRTQFEYTYRHGDIGSNNTFLYTPTGHALYNNAQGESRFFTSTDQYR